MKRKESWMPPEDWCSYVVRKCVGLIEERDELSMVILCLCSFQIVMSVLVMVLRKSVSGMGI